ncbi:hypothetical protein PV10_05141 [Exophiala mesophila]|uniref:CSC1/OSCA1-like 7TM region domain-containing protein n=1 Tax=Exophiala mesophila TaxID=212818 RepID=A0A0D2A4S9_EXOME|nr:uncharacterized protein PV10_05141 [Exophiala mesophila]KIV93973.1 hypothetical protein PV10_05141 [Exophiala mesophila]
MSSFSNLTGIGGDEAGREAQSRNGQSAGQFAASLITAIALFAVQTGVFLLIKDRFARIYQPRTYLVPERERTKPSPPGWWAWIAPVISTSNSEFVQKCGLDAYFFLRYLRTLLKIFVPAALVILPILIPINLVNGRGTDYAVGGQENTSNVTGLDQLAWGNVAPNHTGRYWAHWILALALVIWISFVAFDELRNYIRMRQAYMTSPQHRLRASATTVLVSSIPHKWCNREALDGLYDVFPGGVRNIWINRNYDELSQKISRRDELALKLEQAETDLIKKCFKQNEKNIAKADKEAGHKLSKEEKKSRAAVRDDGADRAAHGHGVTTGDPHQIDHNIRDVMHGHHDRSSDDSGSDTEQDDQRSRDKRTLPIPVLGEGFSAVSHGLNKVGNKVLGGFRGANKELNETIDTTNGFVAPDPRRDPSPEASGERMPPQSRRDPDRPRGIRPSDAKVTIDPRQRVPEPDLEKLDTFDGQRSPLSASSTMQDETPQGEQPPTKTDKVLTALKIKQPNKDSVEYPQAFAADFIHHPDDAVWRRYLTDKDRDTMRLPIFGWQWMFALPLVGQKVDTIEYCRTEVARLNVEIEDDQAHPDRFPLMNSAFIQFNHQVAAHMACQSVSHHIPKQMSPRMVEIDPEDVIWDNMSIPWWSSYIRTFFVVVIIVGLIILWAIPVAFTSALSQLDVVAKSVPWLNWVLDIPPWFRSILQGVLPPALLGLLLLILPMILRALVRFQGTQSGMLVELAVQRYYFFFLFVQLFLVVTIASAVTTFFSLFTSVDGVASIPNLLGLNIPRASNYFFSYMLLQALSVSAGALLQIGSLVGWFILAPILDSTARAKFKRQTDLSNIRWGTFFPVYTNLACIGLIYSVVAPLILIFNIITFALFWFVYRFNTLYVVRFTRDTGGLLYPNAINTTFVGIYVMELALIGMFFLVRDENNDVACSGQAIATIVMLILTAAYQILLNNAFSPLFRYLPITLEDDACRRDEEFARAMRAKQGILDDEETEGEDLEDRLERNEREERREDRDEQEYELQEIQREKAKRAERSHSQKQPELKPQDLQNPEILMSLDEDGRGVRWAKAAAHKTAGTTKQMIPRTLSRKTNRRESRKSWADRSNERNRRSSAYGRSESPSQSLSRERSDEASQGPAIEDRPSKSRKRRLSPPRNVLNTLNNFNPVTGGQKDVEAQRAARTQLADALFSGLNDELEDLSPEERDALVERAFRHSALRAKRPVIWLPRDELGVSDDETLRMGEFSSNIWVSNVRQGLDSKGRCVYSGAPPDFSQVDLIRL